MEQIVKEAIEAFGFSYDKNKGRGVEVTFAEKLQIGEKI